MEAHGQRPCLGVGRSSGNKIEPAVARSHYEELIIHRNRAGAFLDGNNSFGNGNLSALPDFGISGSLALFMNLSFYRVR